MSTQVGFPPVYVATVFKNVGAPRRGEQYTGDEHQRAFWKVGMVNGMMPGITADFFYETLEQASRFRQWEEYTPAQLIQIGGRPWAFVAKKPYRLYVDTVTNRYTDRKQKKEQWRTPFVAPNGEMIELGWPTWAMASQFQVGQGYRLQDMFGTLPAARAPLPLAVKQKIQAAAEAQRELNALRPFLERQQQEAIREGRNTPGPQRQGPTLTPPQSSPLSPAESAPGQSGPPQLSVPELWDALSPPEEGTQPSSPDDTESDQQMAHEAANRQAQQQADQAVLAAEAAALSAAQALYDSSWHPAGRPLSPTDVLWTITNGGAQGWYDGVFYIAGAFLFQGTGNSGTWYGSFSRDGINIATEGTFTDVVTWR